MAQQGFFPSLINTDNQSVNFGLTNQVSPETALEEQALNRRQQIAQLLLQQGLHGPPQGQMVGRFYVPASPVQGLASLAQAAAGIYGTYKNDEARKALADTERKGMQAELAGAFAPEITEGPRPTAQMAPQAQPNYGLAPRPAQAQPVTTELPGPGAPVETPASSIVMKRRMAELLASRFPQVRAMAVIMAQQQAQQQEREAQRDFLKGEGELNRQARLEGQAMQLDQALTMGLITKEQRDAALKQSADLAKQHDETLKAVAQIGAKGKTESAEIRAGAGTQKPMPPSALRMQQEELDAIGSASSVNADLKAIQDQIAGGKLKLGMVENLVGQTKNALGMSDEQSRNLASFKATLEKQRNESLRLNKGVQTEGDSVRAWNELIANINDPQVVTQRLEEIQRLNERAANIRRMNVDVIRQNYGKDPLPTEGYQQQPPAVGLGGSQPVAPFNDAEKERRYQEWRKQHK